ncbi:unnamed protein product [Rotaria sordida]|uniref:F-box domain-containing protein n=1 Tax=Rotaria sordida TaxID=392033 RepID=A0A819C6E4_9BILA|nr:unnamed protein product [Rotaria sordida]CAF1319167.1 unnamed protein product [Rotaria sordida]CAF3814165.1 unnamed protein product [Rotaria sordida]CAF3973616.1 unnamed protein product [Rotaria sordida]
MSERKRQKMDEINNQNLNSVMITKFEQLPNEMILICFSYLSFYWLYETFSCLNQRFNKLILQQTKNSIDLDSIPDENILTFCFKLNNFLRITKNYPLSISTYNEQRFTLIMKDNLFQDKFSKLKSLILSDIHAEPIFNAIFDRRTKLYKTLQRLTLQEISESEEHGHDVERLCRQLISSKMKSLKYLNLNVKPYSCGCEFGIQSRDNDVDLQFQYLSKHEKSLSNLETLIIGDIPDEYDACTRTKLSFYTLTEELLPSLPKLKNLIINSIHFGQNRHHQLYLMPQPTIKTNAVIKLNLESIKIWTNKEWNNENVDKQNKKLLKDFFLEANSSDVTTIKTFYINNESVLK